MGIFIYSEHKANATDMTEIKTLLQTSIDNSNNSNKWIETQLQTVLQYDSVRSNIVIITNSISQNGKIVKQSIDTVKTLQGLNSYFPNKDIIKFFENYK